MGIVVDVVYVGLLAVLLAYGLYALWTSRITARWCGLVSLGMALATYGDKQSAWTWGGHLALSVSCGLLYAWRTTKVDTRSAYMLGVHRTIRGQGRPAAGRLTVVIEDLRHTDDGLPFKLGALDKFDAHVPIARPNRPRPRWRRARQS